ncbi:NAD(P)-binding protein [Exidia glandulosa HHB12029]|uniref:NAD(P)-binding protein n=1 Tax=Exidia glandulosa HHB12029 TaxID=1314781 RepID=A0A165K0Y8_EXIGL|nr:NAD(P)-binding protein [Exidia glandulosa HHB12029]
MAVDSHSVKLACAAALPLVVYLLHRSRRRASRVSVVPPAGERVLVVGASSGVGKEIALKYAARGARVMLTGRRVAELDAAADECRALSTAVKVRAERMDATVAEDVLRVRDVLLADWAGCDTVIIAAGVSALQPLLAVAGVEHNTRTNVFEPAQVTLDGLQRAQHIAERAVAGNYIGILLSLVALIPVLSQTSRRPAVLLVSSLAAVIPAPTRTLYASTKAASLLLFQALAIEHPQVKFTTCMPSTIEGNFRASAVDSGPVRETLEKALKKDTVARACIHGVDAEKPSVWLPRTHWLGPIIRSILPNMIDSMARRKYNFVGA